jgi:hypothetical protein
MKSTICLGFASLCVILLLAPAAYAGGGEDGVAFDQAGQGMEISCEPMSKEAEDIFGGPDAAEPCASCGDGWYCDGWFDRVWRGGTYCSIYSRQHCPNYCVAMDCGNPDYCV